MLQSRHVSASPVSARRILIEQTPHVMGKQDSPFIILNFFSNSTS